MPSNTCWIDGLNATTRLHITPDEITLPDLVARPRQGGIVNAAFRYLNWSAPATAQLLGRGDAAIPATAQRASRPVMSIRARVHGVRLTTVLESVVRSQISGFGLRYAG